MRQRRLILTFSEMYRHNVVTHQKCVWSDHLFIRLIERKMLNEPAFKVFLISAVLKFFIFASQRKRNGTPATATMEDIHVPEAAERAIRLQLASTIPHIRTDYRVSC